MSFISFSMRAYAQRNATVFHNSHNEQYFSIWPRRRRWEWWVGLRDDPLLRLSSFSRLYSVRSYHLFPHFSISISQILSTDAHNRLYRNISLSAFSVSLSLCLSLLLSTPSVLITCTDKRQSWMHRAKEIDINSFEVNHIHQNISRARPFTIQLLIGCPVCRLPCPSPVIFIWEPKQYTRPNHWNELGMKWAMMRTTIKKKKKKKTKPYQSISSHTRTQIPNTKSIRHNHSIHNSLFFFAYFIILPSPDDTNFQTLFDRNREATIDSHNNNNYNKVT